MGISKALEHWKILYLCNRVPLRNEIQREVERLGRTEEKVGYWDHDLRQIVYESRVENKYKDTIRVETYQWMEAFCKANPEGAMDYLKSFRYIVADEYHYLLTDATINKYIDFSYVTLNELTKYRPVIFMSATAHPFFHRWRYETNEVLPHVGSRTSFDDRLSACVCELCGKTNVPLEIHHVNKVKNLKGKQLWELAMIAKKRKTLAVCKDCHHKIHHP